MPDRYTPIPLTERQIDQAFPLIQSIAADVPIEAWRAYARDLLARPAEEAGIMTVQAFDYIHGLFAYRVDRTLQHSRVLLVDSVAVLELFSPRLAMAALLQVMDDMALALECRAIHACVPNMDTAGPETAGTVTTGAEDEPVSRRWMIQQFRDLGHRVDSLKLGKALADTLSGGGAGGSLGGDPLSGMARGPEGR